MEKRTLRKFDGPVGGSLKLLSLVERKDLASCVEQVVDYIDRTFRVE